MGGISYRYSRFITASNAVINSVYTGDSIFPLTLRELGGSTDFFYYLRLFDPQTDAEHVIKLDVIESNNRAQICKITQAQKEPLREVRYFYEVTAELEETTDPQGEAIEVGFFNFKDDRDIDEIYK